MTRTEALVWFRQREKNTKLCLAAVLESKSLRLCLAAWSVTDITLTDPDAMTNAGTDKPPRLWAELWDGCHYDVTDIAAGMGCTDAEARQALQQASHLRLIYPDGTLNALAEAMCNAQIAQAARKTTGGRRGKEE